MELSDFNTLEHSEAAQILLSCAHVERWADEIVSARPYSSVDALAAATQEFANPWTQAEIDSALKRHPRIGERAKGDDADAKMSRAEQARLGIDDDIQRRLDAGNAAYEEKFGFVFLIRAAGRSAEEILRSLDERMNNTPEQERLIAADQLRQIAALRLKGMIS